jgi:predicted metallopeptidase
MSASRRTSGLDFTAAMTRLCVDISTRIEAFHHVQMEQIAVTFAQARRRVNYGLQAKLTPLRFEHGAIVTERFGREWTIRRMYRQETEILYLLTFYLPRFLDQSFREKFITIMHELYHISPKFDGDIRRLEGRYHVHSSSQKDYDKHMEIYVDEYLASSPPVELFEFLKGNFSQIQEHYGSVHGVKIPIPRLIPLETKRSA